MGAGISLKKKVGDFVKKGEELAVLYSGNRGDFAKAEGLMERAFVIGEEKVEKMPLILKVMQ